MSKTLTAIVAIVCLVAVGAAGVIAGLVFASGGGNTACKEALGYADRVQILAGRGFMYASQGTAATINGDLAALTQSNEDLQSVSDELAIVKPKYDDAKEKCN